MGFHQIMKMRKLDMMKMNSNKLTKKDLKRVNWRYIFGPQLGWNYEKMMNIAYTRAAYPALMKLYKNKPQDLKTMFETEMNFFNTSPHLAMLIMGLDLSMQNDVGVESKDAVTAIKTSLMGPFAAVGDSLMGAVLPTILGSLAAYMGLKGNPIGVIIWLLSTFVVLAIRYLELPWSYKMGNEIVQKMTGLLQNITSAATLLGVFVVGGLIPTVVKVIVPLKLKIGKGLSIQSDVLDQILPTMVPVILVWIAYWLLGRKKMNSTKVIWIFLIGSIIAYSLKILAIAP